MTDTTTVITPEIEDGKDINSDPDDTKQFKASGEITPENGDVVSSHGKEGKSKSEQT